MYAITGVTGQVGAIVAKTLLNEGHKVRAVIRNEEKGRIWKNMGCETVCADITDSEAFAEAISDAEGVFILIPPLFDPKPGFPEITRITEALKKALTKAKPQKVVMLSTIGAQCEAENLLTQLGMAEKELGSLPMPTAFLRAGWFMENAAFDFQEAESKGCINTFIRPANKRLPMVSVIDVGRTAAALLTEKWESKRVIELEGPEPYAPMDIAAAFSQFLGKKVEVKEISRFDWEKTFMEQGMKNPSMRIRMLDGFNEGWIKFQSYGCEHRNGTITVDQAIGKMINKKSALIIGASRGLGLAMTEEYLKRGWDVTATVRTESSGKLNELQKISGSRLNIAKLDTTDENDLNNLHKSMGKEKFDVMIINAGISGSVELPAEEVSNEEFYKVMLTNALSPIRIISKMLECVKQDGTAAVMSSELGSVADNSDGGWEVYRMSKAALNMGMRSFVARHPKNKRTLLAIAPGWVKTDMGGEDALLTIEESIPRVIDMINFRNGIEGLRFVNYQNRILPW